MRVLRFSLIGFSFFPLSCGFSCGGAGVCRPSSGLICRHDGFLDVLLVGHFHCMV